MPDDALPQPWSALPAGTVRYRREYRDPLGRPMRGTLTISGARRAGTDALVVIAAPVNVTLAGGVLEVDLPPGEYTLKGTLTTPDSVRVPEESSFTLP